MVVRETVPSAARRSSSRAARLRRKRPSSRDRYLRCADRALPGTVKTDGIITVVIVPYWEGATGRVTPATRPGSNTGRGGQTAHGPDSTRFRHDRETYGRKKRRGIRRCIGILRGGTVETFTPRQHSPNYRLFSYLQGPSRLLTLWVESNHDSARSALRIPLSGTLAEFVDSRQRITELVTTERRTELWHTEKHRR